VETGTETRSTPIRKFAVQWKEIISGGDDGVGATTSKEKQGVNGKRSKLFFRVRL